MRNQLARITLSLAAALIASAPARATPLDPKVVPAAAKWVVHLDADALRESEFGALLLAHLPPEKRGELEKGLDEFNQLAGVRLDVDTHGVTIFGSSFGEEKTVVILEAPIGENAFLPLLKMNAAFQQFPHGDHAVVTWKDDNDGKTHFGSFYSASRVVVGNDRAEVEAAIDVLDGGKSMADDELFKPAAGPGVLAVMYGDGLDALVKAQQPQSPLVDLVRKASFSITETGDTVHIEGLLTAMNADAAKQLSTIAEGGKALLALVARTAQHRDDPKAKAAAASIATAKVTATGDTVKLDWPVSLKTLEQLGHALTVDVNVESGATAKPAK